MYASINPYTQRAVPHYSSEIHEAIMRRHEMESQIHEDMELVSYEVFDNNVKSVPKERADWQILFVYKNRISYCFTKANTSGKLFWTHHNHSLV